jgi:hypothetical protein
VSSFTYSGDDTRYYPTLGLEATPGLVADLATGPEDGRWEPTPKAKPDVSALPPVPVASPDTSAPTNL